MKHILLFHFCFTLSLFALSQPPLYWSRVSSDTTYYAMNHWMITDSFANVYQLGQHYIDTFGRGITLVKYDPSGIKLWEKIDTGGALKHISTSFFCLGDNNSVYVSGGQKNAVTGFDAVILKYDFDGNLLWKKFYNGVSDTSDFAGKIIFRDSAFYLCGNTLNLQYQEVIFIQKYDLNGNLVWTVTDSLNNIGGDGVSDIAFDNNHNLLVTGMTDRNTIAWKMFIAKYNINGTKLWQRIDSSSSSFENMGNKILVDKQNNVCVSTREGFSKFDSTGAFLWRNVASSFNWFGPAPAEYGDMKLDSDGNIYLAGYNAVAGGFDYTVGYLFVKLRPDGSVVFSHNPNTSGTAYSIDILSPNEILVCGGIDTVASVLNFDSLGNINWELHYPYDVPNTGCKQVLVDINKDILLSGMHYVFPHKTLRLIKYGTPSISAIEKNYNANSFSIYPNPNSGEIFVQLPQATSGEFELRISDMLGRETVYLTSETSGVQNISLHHLSKGMYFATLHLNGDRVYSKNIIKE